MNRREAVREIERLSDLLRRYEHEYHVLNSPSVSDREYDGLFDRLVALEGEFPDLVKSDSPTRRVGSDLSSELPEVEHTIPVLSLDKAYSFEDVLSWARKTSASVERDLAFIVEEKIDGASIVLYYEEGLLARAVTRGNGVRGNDITANVRTIRTIPLRLSQPVTVAVRGEIYLPLDRFQEINESLEVPYANPRNLASGSLRRVKSADVAKIPLNVFAYEGFFAEGSDRAPRSHVEVLTELERLGFRVSKQLGLFASGPKPERLAEAVRSEHPSWTVGELDAMAAYLQRRSEERRSLPYEIDGLVVKVDELAARELLGYTGHHPRWAIAYKFEAPEGVSVVQGIDVQVGRTGRITPVARVKPVQIGGSTISNVTLHNQDYVDMLELAVGDTVAVSRRGDVIPAVERVIEKNEQNTTWKMPAACPDCGTALVLLGAHHFCPNRECPSQVRGRLLFFTARGQMDIDNLGPETIDVLIEKGMLREPADIYFCDYDMLAELPGFGEKKIALIKAGVAKSKGQPYRVVLQSLGIPELGQKVAELLVEAGYRSVDELYALVDRTDTAALTAIHGIGEKTAATVVSELSRPEVRRQIERLREAGLNFVEEAGESLPAEEQIFAGQSWCVTGSFERWKPREQAMEEVKRRGGSVVSSVSAKTTHLLAGPGGGSKLEKARALGVKIVSEEEFNALLEAKREG